MQFQEESRVIEKYFFARAAITVARLIPYRIQIRFFALLIRLFLFFSTRYKNIVTRNIEIAFPELSVEQKASLMRRSAYSLARTVADSLRVGKLEPEWFLQNVDFPQVDEFRARIESVRPKGVLCVGGHLGSFELLPSAAAAHTGIRGKVIAREFKNQRLNTWWNAQRGAHGVEVINRSGALRKMLRALKREGSYVGVLFDQNVTRNLATFVNWFGIPAATTIAVGYCAVKLEIPVFVVTIEPAPAGRYTLKIKEVAITDITSDLTLSFDARVQLVTQKVTDAFLQFIIAQPEGWFWMHRRWKTRPSADDPGVY